MNRIFSGVQPTGNLHLGNYLGAISNFVALQDDYRVHLLRRRSACDDPAAGPGRTARHHPRGRPRPISPPAASTRTPSSSTRAWCPEHAELAWVFDCVARLGWLNRMTQFKEKAGKEREMAGLGLYAYPVLMAADILVYRATHVPVGEDQKQHLELARDIAGAFNRRYEPATLLSAARAADLGAATRVMSLRDGTKKMSKSDTSDYSRINMTDDADAIA